MNHGHARRTDLSQADSVNYVRQPEEAVGFAPVTLGGGDRVGGRSR